jgi:hypothetical protein
MVKLIMFQWHDTFNGNIGLNLFGLMAGQYWIISHGMLVWFFRYTIIDDYKLFDYSNGTLVVFYCI